MDCDKNWGPCMGCAARWRQNFRSSAPSRGRTELTAFFCLLLKVIGPIKVHVDDKGIIGGLWRGERKCIDPKAGDADMWVKIWEGLHLPRSKEMLVEVEHVKAHRTKKGKKGHVAFREVSSRMAMTKRMSWQRQDQCWTRGFMAEARAKTVQQKLEEVYAALQYAASFHCWVERMERL